MDYTNNNYSINIIRTLKLKELNGDFDMLCAVNKEILACFKGLKEEHKEYTIYSGSSRYQNTILLHGNNCVVFLIADGLVFCDKERVYRKLYNTYGLYTKSTNSHLKEFFKRYLNLKLEPKQF